MRGHETQAPAEPGPVEPKAGESSASAAAGDSGATPVPATALEPEVAPVPEPTPIAESVAEEAPAAGAAAPEEPETQMPTPREAIAPAAVAVGRRARDARTHTPAAAAAGSAQAAAIDPATEQRRGGAARTVQQIDAAEPEDVDRRTFKERLTDALHAAVPIPRNESEAERVMEQGAADTSARMQGEIGAQSAQAAAPLAAAAAPENEVAPQDQPAPPATPLTPEAVGDPPASVSPASVVPDPLPAQQLDYSEHRGETDALMEQNSVSREQLARGRDPQFDAALGARDSAETNEAAVPGRFREAEGGMRESARGQAAQTLEGGLSDIHGARAGRVANVVLQQVTTQTTDAAERTRITGEIERIKTATREAVNTILGEMETEAAARFERGLAAAEQAYEAVFEEEKGGFFSWLGGSITGTWDETVEQAFRTARRAYERVVDDTIDSVATYVEGKLAEAKGRVAEGRRQVDDFVAGLDQSVAHYGEEARAAIAGDFDAMTGEIDSRRDGLVDTLAQQYAESQQRVSAMEERLRAENKSLWDAVYDATVGVIEKIIEFKNMLLGILARAAAVVGAIIDDPIGFLGNLIAGVKAGLDAFVGNIGQHLKEGLMGWLFGALEGAGLQLPETFDLKGIIDLVLQVLGLTYANIRNRAVRILGEETVSRLEQVAEIFKVLVTEGPAGLWRMLVEKIGDVKEMILGEIRNWVITKIVVAGIKWLISLLNPAAAFVKACMMIYDIVKFFIERGQQIIALVNAIIDTLGAIVAGNISAMATAVEGALARMVPVAISFLAALLGLGGISAKIRQIIETIQRPINAAIDWVINKAVALARRVGQLFSGGKRQEEEIDEETDDPEKEMKLQAARSAIDQAEERAMAAGVTREEAEAIAANVQSEHDVIKSMRVEPQGKHWRYFYRASAEQSHDGSEDAAIVFTDEEITRAKQAAVDRVRSDPVFKDAYDVRVGRYEEILRGSSGELHVGSAREAMALGHAAGSVIRKTGGERASLPRLGGRSSVVVVGEEEVPFYLGHSAPSRTNIVVGRGRYRPTYSALERGIELAAADLGMDKATLQRAFDYYMARAALPPDLNSDPKAGRLRKRLSELMVTRYVSEQTRGESTIASTAAGREEMRQRTARDPQGKPTAADVAPVGSASPEAPSAAAIRRAEDVAAGREPRDERPGPRSKSRAAFDDAVTQQASRSREQIDALLASERGKNVRTFEDLVEAIAILIKTQMLDVADG
jgi:hypothetical protein